LAMFFDTSRYIGDTSGACNEDFHQFFWQALRGKR
jgi:hypothetical protein